MREIDRQTDRQIDKDWPTEKDEQLKTQELQFRKRTKRVMRECSKERQIEKYKKGKNKNAKTNAKTPTCR